MLTATRMRTQLINTKHDLGTKQPVRWQPQCSKQLHTCVALPCIVPRFSAAVACRVLASCYCNAYACLLQHPVQPEASPSEMRDAVRAFCRHPNNESLKPHLVAKFNMTHHYASSGQQALCGSRMGAWRGSGFNSQKLEPYKALPQNTA